MVQWFLLSMTFLCLQTEKVRFLTWQWKSRDGLMLKWRYLFFKFKYNFNVCKDWCVYTSYIDSSLVGTESQLTDDKVLVTLYLAVKASIDFCLFLLQVAGFKHAATWCRPRRQQFYQPLLRNYCTDYFNIIDTASLYRGL